MGVGASRNNLNKGTPAAMERLAPPSTKSSRRRKTAQPGPPPQKSPRRPGGPEKPAQIEIRHKSHRLRKTAFGALAMVATIGAGYVLFWPKEQNIEIDAAATTTLPPVATANGLQPANTMSPLSNRPNGETTIAPPVTAVATPNASAPPNSELSTTTLAAVSGDAAYPIPGTPVVCYGTATADKAADEYPLTAMARAAGGVRVDDAQNDQAQKIFDTAMSELNPGVDPATINQHSAAVSFITFKTCEGFTRLHPGE